MDRLAKLHQKRYGKLPDSIVPLRSDGSDRKIYRLFSGDQTVIGIIGNDFDENMAFVEFSNHFWKNGLRVPEIYISDLRNGVYLEQDLGDDTLFDWMMKIRSQSGFSSEVQEMYRQVIEYLPNFQIKAGMTIDYTFCYQHVIFGKHSMAWDLNYFKNRFLDVFYKKPLDQAAVEKDFNTLIDFLMHEERKYFLYRDFQSRNVMIKNRLPYFIDYQSGRKGALQYDVASLLFDAKADLPEWFRQEMVQAYLQKVQEFIPVEHDRFMKYYYGFVLIRMMQAFGAYGYLSVVKGKKHFFKSVPFAIANLKLLLEKNPEIFQLVPTLTEVYSNLITDHELIKFGKEDE
ncbi:MAG TPA: phosphotransferase enzyme family protein [bacterium]|nr:phosphotransferase enzyme family protein [bacterium]